VRQAVAQVVSPRVTDNVFLNVPFDRKYRSLFRALIFAIHDCGFQSRCALENSDAGEVRVEKIYRIIEECRYGIHDISRTTLDAANRLPRFNMPFELGVFLGAKRYGDVAHRQKNCMILDTERYRFQRFCSDLAGQDIRAHGNTTTAAIAAVRDWLSDSRGRGHAPIPGGRRIAERYEEFSIFLPRACQLYDWEPATITFIELRTLVAAWQTENR
jgi:hypothetical protein